MKIIIISILFISQINGQNYDFHDFQITNNNNAYPSNIFIHTMGSQPSYIAIIDSMLTPSWFINSGGLGIDFKVNQEVLTFFNKERQEWIVLNDKMIEIDTLKCANGYAPDYHDIQILDDGGYILQIYDSLIVNMSDIVEGGNSNAIVIYLIIQEFDQNKNLIFEWNAWDHLEISDYTNLDLTRQRLTWMHGNSIEIDSDLNLLISNRRSSEILKIDRITGDVIWFLGGPNNEFTFVDDSLNGFSKQHDVRRLQNGNILLFDNGNGHNPPISRALEYAIDNTNKTASLIWGFSHPEYLVGLAMGSIQRLPNNNTLINWGTLHNNGAIVTEVDYDKNILLELRFPENVRCYKVRKDDWSFSTNMIPGDVNMDGKVDILDLIYIIDYSSQDNFELSTFYLFRYDLNNDRMFTELDIELSVQKIISSN